MRVLAGVFLDGLGCAAVGVAFTQDRVDGAAFDLVVAGADVLFGVGLRVGREVRDVVALGLQFGDRLFQLRDRCADVRKFDDVRIRLGGQDRQFGKRVRDLLIRRQLFGEAGEDAASERDVAGFHGDA